MYNIYHNKLKVIEKDLDIENIAPGHKGNNLHFMLNPQKFMQVRS